MAISEHAQQIGDIAPSKPGELIEVDFKTGEVKGSHKRHGHDELSEIFGEDYRLRSAAFFMNSGDIKDFSELNWLDSNNDLREHLGSDADYLLWMTSPRSTNILAVSVLPAGKKTSGEHKHRSEPHKVLETYKVISGECDLWIDKRDYRLREKDKSVTVWPGHWHRLQNPNGHAVLVAITIGNGVLYSPDQLHIKAK